MTWGVTNKELSNFLNQVERCIKNECGIQDGDRKFLDDLKNDLLKNPLKTIIEEYLKGEISFKVASKKLDALNLGEDRAALKAETKTILETINAQSILSSPFQQFLKLKTKLFEAFAQIGVTKEQLSSLEKAANAENSKGMSHAKEIFQKYKLVHKDLDEAESIDLNEAKLGSMK